MKGLEQRHHSGHMHPEKRNFLLLLVMEAILGWFLIALAMRWPAIFDRMVWL